MSARFSDLVMLPEGKWNAVIEPSIGSLQTDAVQPRWLGQLGRTWFGDDAMAQKMSDTSIGTLRWGWYQIVQTLSTATAAYNRGAPVFYASLSNMGNYIVTSDQTALTEAFFAGIILGSLTTAQKGSYVVIQVGGACTIKYRATVTDKTAGNLVQLVTTTATFDALGDAVSAVVAGGGDTTHIGFKNVRGVALETPADAGLKLAWIQPINWNWK